MSNYKEIAMPTISVSQEVYDALKEKSRSWEDTPNKIIRRLLETRPSEENSDEAGNRGKQSQPEEVTDQPEKSKDVLADGSLEVQNKPSHNLRDRTTPDSILRKIVMLFLGAEDSGDLPPEMVVRETKKIMELNKLLTEEDLNTIPSGKTKLESKIERLQKRLIIEGLLGHAEGYWSLTAEGKKECDEVKKNSMLPATKEESPNGLDIPKETYRHTRLCFFRDKIEGLEAEESFRVICNDGIFQMTKSEFYEVFNNIIKTDSYLKMGQYHSRKPPAKAMQFKIL